MREPGWRRIEEAGGPGVAPTSGGTFCPDFRAAVSSDQAAGQRSPRLCRRTRRGCFEAQTVEPEAALLVLALIGGLYHVEEHIRREKLTGPRKRDHRLKHAKAIVKRFFSRVSARFAAQGLLLSNRLTKARAYGSDRRSGLGVFLTDSDVPIDTNRLEPALRAITTGRKAWLSCWPVFWGSGRSGSCRA